MPKPRSSSRRSSSSIASITYWRKFAKHRLIYVLLTIIFAFGIVAYFGSGPWGGLGSSQAERLARAQEPVVTVNGEPVTRGEYERGWENYRRFGGGSDLQAVQTQGRLLQSLIQTAANRAAAKQRGLTVSDADIDRRIAEEKKGGGGKPISDDQFEQMLQMQGLTLADYRENLRRDLLPQKLQESFVASQKITEEDLLKSYDELKLRHILISVSGGPRPTPNALPDAQAKRRAEQILREIKAGGDFAALANKYTTDPSNTPQTYDPKTKKTVKGRPKGGDLGWYRRGGGFVKEFEDAAFALKPGQVSDVVKTQFGYHIIKVEKTRRQLPKDFEKQKAQLLEKLKQQQGMRAYSDFITEQQKNLKLTWHDPSLQWRYEYSQSGSMMMPDPSRPQVDQEALQQRLRAYVKDNPNDAAAALVLGEMLHRKYMLAGINVPGQGGPSRPPTPKEREALRKEIIELYNAGLASTEDQNVRFTLARLYQENKQTDEALAQYNMIKRLLSWDDSPMTIGAHRQLETAFKTLGKKDLAAQEAKKIAELEAKQKKEEEEWRKAEAEAARARAAAEKEKKKAAAESKSDDKKSPATSSSTGQKTLEDRSAKPGASRPDQKKTP